MTKSTKKQDTKNRITLAASHGFRSHGFAGVGVDGIAKSAGVTSGAFYAHLGSKDRAFEAALLLGLGEVVAAVPEMQREHGKGWIVAFAEYYLGEEHRENRESGCAMTTLSPEVVRTTPELRAIYEAKMQEIVLLMAEGLTDSSKDERVSRAWAILGILIGGLTLARAVESRGTAELISASIKDAAINAAKRTKKLPSSELPK